MHTVSILMLQNLSWQSMANDPESRSNYGWDDYPPSSYLSEKIDQYVIFGESQVGKTTFLDKVHRTFFHVTISAFIRDSKHLAAHEKA